MGYWRTLVGMLRALPRMARAIWRARAMARRWPLHGWKEHLDVPLVELRERYGIRPV